MFLHSITLKKSSQIVVFKIIYLCEFCLWLDLPLEPVVGNASPVIDRLFPGYDGTVWRFTLCGGYFRRVGNTGPTYHIQNI